MTTLPDRLTALDGTFLELEDADIAAHMHIGAILVFGPRPGDGSPDVDEVRAYLAPRLGALPRYTQRLAGPGAGGLTWQQWVADERFDIDHHVTAATLPAPAGWEELLTWAGEYFSVRLDRRRALWEVVVVGGLADDHWALVTKTHHCLVDGVGSVDAAHLLLDGVADSAVPPTTQETSGFGPLPGWLSPRSLVHGAGVGIHAATHPGKLVRRAAALGELLVREELHGAPESSLNGPIGPRRTLRAVGIDLEEAEHVKVGLGGTVNDVVLAGVCAGLRALLLARDEQLPAQGLRAMVPMNIRSSEDEATLGNRISSLFVDLPVAEANAIVRYELVREAMASIKDSNQPLGADSLLQLTGAAPPVVHQLLARTLFAKRLFNVTVTNVPGPQTTLTALGAQLKTVWPLVPIAADHAVGIAIFSYDGRLTFGINADRASVADIDVLADGIVEGLAELQQLAHAAAPA
jgi:WS/DGAT/MGAT family acyltransferase